MDTDEPVSNKRGPSSPGGDDNKPKKKPVDKADNALIKAMNLHLGFIEQTIALERAKKLTVASAENMSERTTAIRALFTDVCLENSRLRGITQVSTTELNGILASFTKSLSGKCDEIGALKNENAELKAKLAGKECMSKSEIPVVRPVTYAEIAVGKGEPKPKPKNKNTLTKKALENCRETKSGTKFTVDIPEGETLAKVKSDLWIKVKGKLKNPRAKTVVRDKTLIIIPDDAVTLEVLKQVSNLKEVGPRQPRIIIYDVDSDISEAEMADGLLVQNPELGLTQTDIDTMRVKHKLGPRNGYTTHWVIETPASVLPKLENKTVFLGMTRCRIKLHKTTSQCYRCQKYGHTSLKCNQAQPTCRHCAEAHDSRECPNKQMAVCANCRLPHKASSSTCKAKVTAVKSLLRRTDFTPK
ncbi:uncharacterized protein LOC126554580 [Aphis gossypii]|uniref:uncharacterized protein LOC126554580 n=1 Tax=Aphis gossypii TaxID=80765 RepID=UPI002158B586|nr:uncharacterized protein LOC126554580 [Aphis gossypii]